MRAMPFQSLPRVGYRGSTFSGKEVLMWGNVVSPA